MTERDRPPSDGPSDGWYNVPETPEFEEKECKGCGVVQDVNVESEHCDDCLDRMGDDAAEAQHDQEKDEGRTP